MLTDAADNKRRDDAAGLEPAAPVPLEPLGWKRLIIGVGAIALLTGLGVVGAAFEVGTGAPSSIAGQRVGSN